MADLGMLRRRHIRTFRQLLNGLLLCPAVARCGRLGGAIRSGLTHWPPQFGQRRGEVGDGKGAKNTCCGPVAALRCKRAANTSFKTRPLASHSPRLAQDPTSFQTVTTTDFALTGPIRHGCLELARHKRQHEQGQFAKGCVRPLPRPEAPVHLGSQGATVPALCPGKRRVHRPFAAPNGPASPAVSQCQQQQQQPHPWSEPRSIQLDRGESHRARLRRRGCRHAHEFGQRALSPSRFSPMVSKYDLRSSPPAQPHLLWRD